MNTALRLGAAAVLASAALAGARAQTAGNSCAVRTPTLQGQYAGECLNGFASGRGRAAGADRYEGLFRDGQPNGFGVYAFADGRRFEGEFADGKVGGRARFFYSNGDVLEGEFRDNQLVGTGRMSRRSGDALLVQIQGGTMTVLGVAPPGSMALPPGLAPAAPVTAPAVPAARPPAATVPFTPDAPAAPVPVGTPPGSPAAAVQWSPRLDFEDIFPSYVFATATRKPPPAPAPLARSAGASRGDTLGRINPAYYLKRSAGEPATLPAGSDAATARYLGTQGEASYLGDPWGLVGIRIRNTEPGAQVQLSIAIDEIAETTESSFTLPAAGDYVLYPRIRYRYDKLRAVTQPTPVNVSWTVSVNGRPAGTQNGVARVRALQDAPTAVNTVRGLERLLWVYAGFVTEEAPWIDELLRDAFAGSKVSAVGYQVDADGVDRQVEAIYQMLRKRGVRYSSISRTSSVSQVVFSQTVRFPSDSIRTAQANCIDGTVLMASILRKIGIEPIIVTGPGHALLAYFRVRPGSGDKPDVGFVETTLIGGADFAAALKAGEEQVAEWLQKNKDDPSFQILPVLSARNQGVMSIPR